jgi:hypothetical protein
MDASLDLKPAKIDPAGGFQVKVGDSFFSIKM